MQLIPKNYPTYKMLALEIFVECEHKEIEPIRKALYDFYKLLEGTNEPGSPTLQEFHKYLLIAHLVNLKFLYESRPGAQNLHQKITVSLLRYCEFIRLDKVFYEAGMSCQKSNDLGLASVLLNRFLDIADIIDDPDNNNLPEDDEFDTISGFLMHQLGRVPKQGETIAWNGLKLSVVEASRRRAELVHILSSKQIPSNAISSG